MSRLLYHYMVYMPAIRLPGRISLLWTRHAISAAEDEGLGEEHLPRTISTAPPLLLVELEVSYGRPSKALLRIPLAATGRRDLCLVIVPDAGGIARVVTCWTNVASDTHSTLDRSRYESAPTTFPTRRRA